MFSTRHLIPLLFDKEIRERWKLHEETINYAREYIIYPFGSLHFALSLSSDHWVDKPTEDDVKLSKWLEIMTRDEELYSLVEEVINKKITQALKYHEFWVDIKKGVERMRKR